MSVRHLAVPAALAILITACGPDAVSRPEGEHVHPEARLAGQGPAATIGPELAAVRAATAPFRDLAVANARGWTLKITGCRAGAEGGMGFHLGKEALLDTILDPRQPEVLLYEPQRNGSPRLVGVEYIVPRAAWTGATPPVLFGREFPYIEEFDVYGLHVWVWRENPGGMFAANNPRVSCAFEASAD